MNCYKLRQGKLRRDDDGDWVPLDEAAAEIERLRAQLRSEAHGHKQMSKEVERLTASHVHCDHCGGSWLGDGINSRCRCQEIERLRNLYREARRRVYCFDPTSHGRLGEEEFDAETEHHLDEAAEAAGGNDE